MYLKKNAIVLAMISATLIVGCSINTDNGKEPSNAAQTAETDMTSAAVDIVLSEAAFLAKTENTHTSYEVVGEALKITFDEITEAEKNSKWPNMKFRPVAGSYDWNTKGGLKLKLENPGNEQVRIEMKVVDAIGSMGAATHQLDLPIYIDAGKTKTVDFLFNGLEMNIEGYRGGSELDLKNIVEFQFYSVGPTGKQEVIVHAIDYIDRTGDFVVSEARTDVVKETSIATVLSLTDFENSADDLVELSLGTTVTEVTDGGDHAVQVAYGIEESYPTIKFSPGVGKVWDWSKYGDVAFAFDAKNIGDKGAQVFLRVDDDADEKLGGKATGVVHSRTGYVQLPPNSSDTYYFTLKDVAEAMNSGMRGEPPKKEFSATQVVFGWGESGLDISNISSIQLYMMNPQNEATIVYDNLRLIPNLSNDTARYVGLIDQFGQYIDETWPTKVTSEAQLVEQGKTALKLIDSAKPLSDRSRFGGWAKGPKLKGTGYFRTEKVGDKWSIVDPEGYLYFATGLDNIRMDDLYTTTGMGLASIAEVSTDNLRPSEVSDQPYNENTEPRTELSPLRHGMFTWLPDYDAPLAQNYNYTEMIHTGPLDHGEIFSFYGANLMRKYETDDRAKALDIWQDSTLARMTDWGFTSLGNWSDPSFYGNGKIPYTAHGWIIGNHKRIDTGNDYWGPMHDPFDANFRQSVATMAKKVSGEVKNDPFCIGYFVDNELSWGNTVFDANHFALALSGLRGSAADSPTKAAFDKFLKGKYGSIAKLNSAWGTDIASWETFAKGFNYQGEFTENVKADLSDLLYLFADQYFKVVSIEMEKVMPNHMNLGSRFSDWGITPEAAKAAAKYVDVMSYNLYATDLESKGDWSRLPELDKPSIIGEFHFGSLDSGMFHPGLLSVDSQADRGKAYAKYMQSIIDNPYFVGAHWFQYVDSPVTGRAWDGENYNVGFVSITDTPYLPLINAAKEVNVSLYERRYGDVK
ncbi:beta-galactosidase [Psychromonas sp. MME2]|uniref:beta-galactosidase n=1 Tax=unclassified Psychromonas TaxID=2614957 RepID=UPI00339CE0F5